MGDNCRTLDLDPKPFKDITHYRRIVKVLAETDRIVREIELPLDGAEAG